MTYREDFILPAELLEWANKQGIDILAKGNGRRRHTGCLHSQGEGSHRAVMRGGHVLNPGQPGGGTLRYGSGKCRDRPRGEFISLFLNACFRRVQKDG